MKGSVTLQWLLIILIAILTITNACLWQKVQKLKIIPPVKNSQEAKEYLAHLMNEKPGEFAIASGELFNTDYKNGILEVFIQQEEFFGNVFVSFDPDKTLFYITLKPEDLSKKEQELFKNSQIDLNKFLEIDSPFHLIAEANVKILFKEMDALALPKSTAVALIFDIPRISEDKDKEIRQETPPSNGEEEKMNVE